MEGNQRARSDADDIVLREIRLRVVALLARDRPLRRTVREAKRAECVLSIDEQPELVSRVGVLPLGRRVDQGALDLARVEVETIEAPCSWSLFWSLATITE
jgi:hypothetical protein